MALLPYALRPSVIIRRKAIRQGFLGPSLFWKVVGGFVFGRSSLQKFFGKNDEPLGTQKFGAGSFASIAAVKPMTKKQQRAAGITKERLAAQAATDVADSWAAKVAASSKPKRKVVRRADKTATMAAAARAKADKADRKARKKLKRAS